MSRVKICGLSRPEDIRFVNEAAPDFCGFVIGVPSSRRNVTAEQLGRLREYLADEICPVGVFVNADPVLAAGLLNSGVIQAAQEKSLTGNSSTAGKREPGVRTFWQED